MNFKMVLLFYVFISLFKRIFELILFYHYICIEYFLDPELTVCLRVNTVKLDVKYMRMGETRLFFFFTVLLPLCHERYICHTSQRHHCF